MFEDGLYNIMKYVISDFYGIDNNGNQEYKMYYLGVFDPVPPPYCVFKRYERLHEMDLQSKNRQFNNKYLLEIYHNDSWALLKLQQNIRKLLESLVNTTIGGIYVQQLEVEDDYHDIPPAIIESKLRLFKGILDFTMYENPD